jgi:hypothetical protein
LTGGGEQNVLPVGATMTESSNVSFCGHQFAGPAHVCAFFESPDEKYEMLLPFFREGLENRDSVLNVVEDGAFTDHVSRLRRAGVPVRSNGDAGVEVRQASETYFASGHFEPLAIFGLIEAKLADANRAGSAVRTFGEMSWVADVGMPADRVMEYEARVNQLTARYECTLVCGYDLGRVSGSLLSDIVATHPYVVLNGRVRENPWYVDPRTYLDELLRGGFAGWDGPTDMVPLRAQSAAEAPAPDESEPPAG